jgi:hypothetical protein
MGIAIEDDIAESDKDYLTNDDDQYNDKEEVVFGDTCKDILFIS